jgi:hypothetical protein
MRCRSCMTVLVLTADDALLCPLCANVTGIPMR